MRQTFLQKIKIFKFTALFIFIPIFIRWFFFNAITDLPLSWFMFAVFILITCYTLGGNTRNGSHEIPIYGNSIHIRTIMITPFCIALAINTICDDFKNAYIATFSKLKEDIPMIVRKNSYNKLNYDYIKKSEKEEKDRLELVEWTIKISSLPTKLISQATYSIFLPILDRFDDFTLIKAYKISTVNKLEDRFKGEIKQNSYSKYANDYLSEHGDEFKSENFKPSDDILKDIAVKASEIVYDNFVSRTFSTFSIIFRKVFLFRSFLS